MKIPPLRDTPPTKEEQGQALDNFSKRFNEVFYKDLLNILLRKAKERSKKKPT